MILLIYYLVLVLLGDFVTVVLCLWIERAWPSASLPTFLVLYFAILLVAWVWAVRLTEPKEKTAHVAGAVQDKPRR